MNAASAQSILVPYLIAVGIFAAIFVLAVMAAKWSGDRQKAEARRRP